MDLIIEYIGIRLRQFRVMISLSGEFAVAAVVELKSWLVRKMYWGRTPFYKTAFHGVVILTTALALYAGIGPRLLLAQRSISENISVSERNQLYSDLETQQANFTNAFPTQTDDVYITYAVKSGDSLDSIAQQFSPADGQGSALTADVIRWANDIPAGRDTLRVGQQIKVPLVNGVLYTTKAGDTVAKVLAKVKLQNPDANIQDFRDLNAAYINGDDTLQTGVTIMLPNAVLLPPATPARPRPVVRPPVVNPPTGGSGRFVNPMQKCSYGISRGYFARHTGVDLATNRGCHVVSAGDGVVSRAGICADLGWCVVVRHANGFSTVYGHGNGTFYVRAGQAVSAGQEIMQSGCSGRCSGPHVHFSMANNNNDVYGCYSCRINPLGIVPY